MRLGVCCAAADVAGVLAAGFDYAETPAGELFKEPCVKCVATNQFFPFGARLFGPDPFDWRAYVDRLLDRAVGAGVEIMVIGSGAARHSDPSQRPGDADEAFMDIAAEISHKAAPRGVIIAPESLRQEETDVANDAEKLAAGLLRRGTAYTLDIYHALVEWRRAFGLAAIDAQFVERHLTINPAHVHLSDIDRSLPQEGDPLVALVLRRLVALGFNGRVSLECSDGVMEDLALARARVAECLQDGIR